MIVIGLCGGSGSGKTLVCRTILSLGIPVFESDAVYHRLIASSTDCAREIVNAFGEQVMDTRSGGIDRRALSRIVFSDSPDAKERLQCLNRITHRHVAEEFYRWRDAQEKSGATCVVLEAPLLFESGLDRLCTVTIAVTAPKAIRLTRIMARDGISQEEAVTRISVQRTDEELVRSCDYVIENTGTMTEVRDRISHLIKNILNRG